MSTIERKRKKRPEERQVNYQSLQQIGNLVSLLRITPTSFQAKANSLMLAFQSGSIEQEFTYFASRLDWNNRQVLCVTVNFSHTCRSENEELASVSGVLLVVYEAKEGVYDFSQDDLDCFAEVNGTYNSWSYIRELVDNCLIRLGGRGATLPLYRPPKALPPKGISTTIRSRPIIATDS